MPLSVPCASLRVPTPRYLGRFLWLAGVNTRRVGLAKDGVGSAGKGAWGGDRKGNRGREVESQAPEEAALPIVNPCAWT